jgi:hypothetical protein
MPNQADQWGVPAEVDFLVVLRARIDQHLRFFDTLERIRWQFTTAFGAGASAAIVFALDDKASARKEGILLLLVFGFSLAGIITQVRIFALISVLWKRMLLLQRKEFELLEKGIQGEVESLRSALSFPRLGVLTSLILRVLNVGMMSSFLFSLLIGIGAGLGVDVLWHSKSRSITLGLVITLVFATVSLVGGKRYAVAIESSVDEF